MGRFTSWSEAVERFREVTSDILSVDQSEITLEASFVEDLGADSLDVTELLLAYEEEFDITVPDEAAERIWLVRDALEHIMNEIVLEEGDKPQEEDPERQDLTYPRLLAFRIRLDGSIEVSLQATDGSWIYADDASRLPSGIYVVTLGGMADILGELEALVNSPKVREQDLQSFFERYPELLQAGDYQEVIPQAVIRTEDGVDWKADFVLKPLDQRGFCKILELKLPGLPANRKSKSGHLRFYSSLLSAVHQLRDYGEAFLSSQTRRRFREEYKIDVYKPDLQLIAGRAWQPAAIHGMQDLQRQHGVQIVDWDTHLESLKRKFI